MLFKKFTAQLILLTSFGLNCIISRIEFPNLEIIQMNFRTWNVIWMLRCQPKKEPTTTRRRHTYLYDGSFVYQTSALHPRSEMKKNPKIKRKYFKWGAFCSLVYTFFSPLYFLSLEKSLLIIITKAIARTIQEIKNKNDSSLPFQFEI